MRISICVWVVLVGFLFGSFHGKAETITSPEALADWYDLQVDELPPAPVFGGESMELNASPRYVCTALQRFSHSFVNSLITHEEYGLYLYDLWIIADRLTGEMVFYNEDFEEVAAVGWYDSEDVWLFGVYALSVTLVDELDWDDLQAALEEDAEEEEVPLMQPMMMSAFLSGTPPDPATYIRAGIDRLASNITVSMIVSNGFTNTVEIYSTDDLLTGDWAIRATNLQFAGGYTNTWTDSTAGNTDKRFYIIGNGGLDLDGDGLIDAREAFIYLTDRTKFDTDGDGIGDGEEVLIDGTDPLDVYSVRPPDMLHAEGASLVDESGNPVVLKSINAGNWLAWEQWMLEFQPRPSIDLVGLSTTDASESDMLDWLMANVDGQVTLFATNYDVAVGTVKDSWYAWINGYSVNFMKSFDTGDYLGFLDRDFGAQPGVSNLAVGIAVPDSYAGKEVEVRLGSSTGIKIGSLIPAGNGPAKAGSVEWVAFTEQHITLSQSMTGTQSIYFVGSGGNGIGNLFSFRFYREPTNTIDLVETFRDFYFVTNDLDRIKSLGYNTIRLPFFYRLLEDDIRPYTYKQSGWDRLDWVIDECATRRLWVLLDLHGTAGGVDPWHSCGEKVPFRNRLWHNEAYLDRTEELWRAIAARYRTNTTVVGYDLINEPSPPVQADTAFCRNQAFSNDVLPTLDRLYDAVRSTDTVHLVFMEGNQLSTNLWDDARSWPAPSAMGWSNTVIEFHAYAGIIWSDYDDQFEAQKEICDENVLALTEFRDARNVPVFIGEFQPGDPENHDYAYRRYNANGIHWCHWNYRSHGWMDSSRPEKGATCWGLDYRSKATTNLVPNLRTDSLSTLYTAFEAYTYTNYEPYAQLQQVVLNNTSETETDYCEFYQNTFSCPNGLTLGDGWAWDKITGIGNTNAFRINTQQARIYLNLGPVVMRWKSRVEADARFQINDETGCWFELQTCKVDILAPSAGVEAEIRLSIVRDEITSDIKRFNSPGLITRMEYDADAANTSVNFYVYRKTGGTNTWGTLLFSKSGVPFSTNALRLHVTSNTLSLIYNDVTQFMTNNHGLNVGAWSDGGVCVTEVEGFSEYTEYVDLDNFRAWRDNTAPVTTYEGTFTNAPDGMQLRAWMGDVAVKRNWSNARDTTTYVTNSRVILLPGDNAGDSTWLNARKDFQNDVRLNVEAGGVAEVRVALREFDNGFAKLGLMPEYFSGLLYDHWNGVSLYVNMERSGSLIKFRAFRTYGTAGSRTPLAGEVSVTYNGSADVTVQVSSNWFKAYYGTNVVVNAAHGLSNYTQAYPNGLHPHLEYQSGAAQACIGLDALKCRMIDYFSTPEE